MCKHMGLLEAFLVMFHPKLDIYIFTVSLIRTLRIDQHRKT